MKFFSVFVLAVVVCGAVCSGAQINRDGNPTGECGDGCSWVVDLASHVLTISGDGWMKNYTQGTHPTWFEHADNIYEAVIESDIKSIGSNVFREQPTLKKVEVKGTLLSLASGAFYKVPDLTTVIIHGLNNELSGGSFTGCVSLTTLTIESGTIPTIGYAALQDCVALTSLTLPTVNGDIAENALYNCTALPKLAIQGTVTSIAKNAFSWCQNLADFSISEMNGEIQGYAFEYAGLRNFKVGGYVKSLEFFSRPSLNKIETVEANIVGGIPVGAFRDRKNLVKFVVRQLNNVLQENVFRDCKNLATVSIGGNEKYVRIGANAFNGCLALTSFSIPATVTSIGNQAFMGCSNLEYLWYGGNNDIMGSSTDVLTGCDKLEHVSVPKTYADTSFCGKDIEKTDPPPTPTSSSSDTPTPGPAGGSSSSPNPPPASSTHPNPPKSGSMVSVGSEKHSLSVIVPLFLAFCLLVIQW